LCSAPGDIISASLLWLITLGGYLIHKRLLRMESRLALAPAVSRREEPSAQAPVAQPPG
jgi:hypothetical protein